MDPTKIYNPSTKRYIAIDGVTGKKLIKQYLAGEITLAEENVKKINNIKENPTKKVADKSEQVVKKSDKKPEQNLEPINFLEKVNITDVKAIDKDTFVIHLDEFGSINPISSQGTSKIYNGLLGNTKFYIKDVVKNSTNKRTNNYGFYDIELAVNELLASKIYTDIYGIDAIHLFLVVNTNNNNYPRYMIASKAIEIDTCEPITKDCQDLIDNKIQGAIEPLLVDCILANWDVGSRGNVGIISRNKKRAFRIDVGGSLVFRAMGQKRQYPEVPNEHVNFFIPSNKGYKLFKNLNEKQVALMYKIVKKAKIDEFMTLKLKLQNTINDLHIPSADKKLALNILNIIDITQKRHEFYMKNQKNIEQFLLEKIIH